MSAFSILDLHNHRKDHRITLSGFVQITAKVVFDCRLHSCPILDPFSAAALNCFDGNIAQLFHQFFGFLHIDKAAGNNVRTGDQLAVLTGNVDANNDHTVLRQMLSVPEHYTAHIAYAGAVHKYFTGRYSSVDFAGSSGQLNHAAQLCDPHIFGRQAHLCGKLAVNLQMPLLAVDGDEELEVPHSFRTQLQRPCGTAR